MAKITRIGGYAVIQNEGSILLCQLTRSRLWTLPGGGLEFGESPVDAMIREVKEETGFDVEQTALLGVNSFVATRADDMHFVQIIYTANIIGGEMVSETDGTTDHCAWQSLDDVNNLAVTPAVSFALAKTP